MRITYSKRGSWHLVHYRVSADGTYVGTTYRVPGGWSASTTTGKHPARTLPSRKAAAEWLVAASGLWLVNP